MSLLDHLVRELSTWRRERSAQEREELSGALEYVFSLMTALVEVDRVSSERALWIQAQLRSVYESVSALSTRGAASGERDPPVEPLANAIAAARLYFWLRTFHEQHTVDGRNRKELAELASETTSPTVSYCAALQSVSQQLEDDDAPVMPAHVLAAKADALGVMADAKTALHELLP